MSGLEEGSGADDDWYVESDGDAISLWLIFGVCVIAALGMALLYQCRRSPPEDLTEGLVAVRMARDNDITDEDDEVFGRLDSKV